jgi:hypothetical protein
MALYENDFLIAEAHLSSSVSVDGNKLFLLEIMIHMAVGCQFEKDVYLNIQRKTTSS